MSNLEKRFEKLPIVAAFSIFQFDNLPNQEDSTFHNYEKDNIKQLAEQLMQVF